MTLAISQTSVLTNIETLTKKIGIRDHSNVISRLKISYSRDKRRVKIWRLVSSLPVFCLAGNHGFGAESSEENLVPLREEQDERGQPSRLLRSGSSVPLPKIHG